MTPSDRVARLRADAAADLVVASRHTRPRRGWLVVLTVVYAAVLAGVLFWPVHVDGEGGLLRFDVALEFLARLGVPQWARYLLVETASNVVLFVPLGALWAAWAPERRVRRVLTATGLGGAVSLCAETVQQVLLPDRTFDLRDVAANTLGAALGAIAVVAIAAANPRSP
jgi:glycopeptide antibiotics resistance protein